MNQLNFTQYQPQISQSCFNLGQTCVSEFEKACQNAISHAQTVSIGITEKLLLIMCFAIVLVSVYVVYLKWELNSLKKQHQKLNPEWTEQEKQKVVDSFKQPPQERGNP